MEGVRSGPRGRRLFAFLEDADARAGLASAAGLRCRAGAAGLRCRTAAGRAAAGLRCRAAAGRRRFLGLRDELVFLVELLPSLDRHLVALRDKPGLADVDLVLARPDLRGLRRIVDLLVVDLDLVAARRAFDEELALGRSRVLCTR